MPARELKILWVLSSQRVAYILERHRLALRVQGAGGREQEAGRQGGVEWPVGAPPYTQKPEGLLVPPAKIDTDSVTFA